MNISYENKYDSLKLANQLCFPLYACSREIIKLYKPHLDKLDLTYTQYIAMMVLWEMGPVTVKEMGSRLYLDSGTLTPLLKKMEAKGLITRRRSTEDERSLIIRPTESGLALREAALEIPARMANCLGLTDDEALRLGELIGKVLINIEKEL